MNGMHETLSFLVLIPFTPFVFYDTHDAWQFRNQRYPESSCFTISALLAW